MILLHLNFQLLKPKMSSRRGKTPGWAAFDLKQQQKQGLELETGNDPYPPILRTSAPLHACQNFVNNDDLAKRPFSSVLLPSVDFPALTADRDFAEPFQVRNSSADQGNKLIQESSVDHAYEKLKELHCWAEKSLIEDIMAAVGNNIEKASTLLKAMVSFGSFEENKEANVAGMKMNSEALDHNSMPADRGVPLRETTDLRELGRVLEDCLRYKNKELTEDDAACGKLLPEDGMHTDLIQGDLMFVPTEPEWEEDDVYLIHRKDAIRMMRSASRHSRAATGAYSRGDHLSADQFSLKAQKERMAAERLNTEAAKEILSIRNHKNDLWTLDLHGLHAAEAVQALQEHLQKIECLVPQHRLISPDKANAKAGIGRSASFESLVSCLDVEKLYKQRALTKRQTPLQVITGRGNHSRGEAALPTAVRSFLSGKGYHYDETRPGVITVRPKFHCW